MADDFTLIPNNADPTHPFILPHLTNVVKLTQTNHIKWKPQINSALSAHDMFEFLDGSHPAPDPTHPAYPAWFSQDQLILSALLGTLSTSVAWRAVEAETSKGAWDVLERTYSKPARGHVKQLKERINHVFKGTRSVDEYMNDIKACADQLAGFGKAIGDRDVICCVVKGLDSAYKSVVDEVVARGMCVGFEEVYEMLLDREDEILVVCQWCGEIGHVVRQCGIFWQQNPDFRFPE